MTASESACAFGFMSANGVSLFGTFIRHRFFNARKPIAKMRAIVESLGYGDKLGMWFLRLVLSHRRNSPARRRIEKMEAFGPRSKM